MSSHGCGVRVRVRCSTRMAALGGRKERKRTAVSLVGASMPFAHRPSILTVQYVWRQKPHQERKKKKERRFREKRRERNIFKKTPRIPKRRQ